MTESNSETVSCPQCGEAFVSVGGHWAQSSECSYPELTGVQQDILTGLLLTGGSIPLQKGDRDRKCRLVVTSTNKAFLEWVDEQFPATGIFGGVYTSAEDAEAKFRDRGVTGPINADTVYIWKTRNHPALTQLRHAWDATTAEAPTDDADDQSDDAQAAALEALQPPTDFRPAPLSLKLAFARAGYVGKSSAPNGEYSVFFRMSGVRGTHEFWMDALSRFSPRYLERDHDHPENTPLIYLVQSREFFTHIAGDGFLGDQPVPGYAEKWPSPQQRLSTAPEAATCPQCGGDYPHLAAHWRQAPDCEYPAVTDRHQTLLTGTLLATGSVIQTASRYPSIRFTSAEEQHLQWLHDELGVLARTLHTIEGESVEDPFGDGDVTYGSYTLLDTRTHPAFQTFRDQWMADGEKTIPTDTIDRSPLLLKAFYLAGGRYSITRYEKNYPCIALGRLPASTEFFLDLFEPFRPSIQNEDRNPTLTILDPEAFFDYIGDPPRPTLADKWDPDTTTPSAEVEVTDHE